VNGRAFQKVAPEKLPNVVSKRSCRKSASPTSKSSLEENTFRNLKIVASLISENLFKDSSNPFVALDHP
jgi:hypothetical protein